MKKPTEINILGYQYSVEYFDNPAEVDPDRRKALWGCIDYWDRTIRVYDKQTPSENVFHTLLHETLHGICSGLKLDDLNKDEDTIDLISMALADVIVRNGWMTLWEQECKSS